MIRRGGGLCATNTGRFEDERALTSYLKICIYYPVKILLYFTIMYYLSILWPFHKGTHKKTSSKELFYFSFMKTQTNWWNTIVYKVYRKQNRLVRPHSFLSVVKLQHSNTIKINHLDAPPTTCYVNRNLGWKVTLVVSYL